MTLADDQHRFCAWLRDPDTDPGLALQGLGPGVAVYQNNYRVALVEALRATHPRAAQWLGDGFEALAAQYVDAHPPSSWTIDVYGAGFLRQADAIAADLAAIDRAVGEAFVAADAVPATPGDLAGVDWDRAVIRPVPSLIVLPIAGNADAIWLAMVGETDWPEPQTDAPATLLIWRQGFETVLRRADADDLAMLAADSFAALCAQWAAQGDEAEAVTRAGTVLGRWLGEALVAGFEAA